MARAWSLAAVLGAAAGATGQVTFTPLPALPVAGGGYGSPRGVSGDGTTATGYANYLSSAVPARWTGGAAAPVPMLSGGAEGEARAASGDGSVIVGYTTFSSAPTAAFRWTASGGTAALGGFPSSAVGHTAFDVSGDGSVVVGLYTSAAGSHSYRWSSGAVETIGDLSGGMFAAGRANAVSHFGTAIVGRSINGGGFTEAYRQVGSLLTGLGDLPGGAFSSEALGVTADGSVVVGRSESAAGVEAFRWEAGVMTGLGDLPGGGFASEALGVSADGSVIVGWGTGAAGPVAVVWRGSGGAEDLKSLLLSLGATGLEGWTLTGASDVSLDGMTIVGYGTNAAGLAQGWMVTIPVPASIGVLALGLAIRRRMAG